MVRENKKMKCYKEYGNKHRNCNKINIIFLSLLSMILFLSLIVSAHTEEDFAKAGELIKQKISCSQLSDEQLELIGEYYMEQMHPGELHEIMDERMGGEGSETLKQVHVNIARSFYCGESRYMSKGMMNTMMGRSGYGMMGNTGFYSQNQNNQIYNVISIILAIAVTVILVLLIITLIKKLQGGKK